MHRRYAVTSDPYRRSCPSVPNSTRFSYIIPSHREQFGAQGFLYPSWEGPRKDCGGLNGRTLGQDDLISGMGHARSQVLFLRTSSEKYASSNDTVINSRVFSCVTPDY